MIIKRFLKNGLYYSVIVAFGRKILKNLVVHGTLHDPTTALSGPALMTTKCKLNIDLYSY